MDKLFFMRLSDNPANVIGINRINPSTRNPECMVIFSANNKTYSFSTPKNGGVRFIAELNYNHASVHERKASTGNPGGYEVVRMGIVWNNEDITKFIS